MAESLYAELADTEWADTELADTQFVDMQWSYIAMASIRSCSYISPNKLQFLSGGCAPPVQLPHK